MATLRSVFPDRYQETPITTLAELKASIPAMPQLPSLYSLYSLEGDGWAIEIVYGSPDRHRAEVKRFTGTGVERAPFDTFNAATERFFALAQDALH